MIKKRIKYLYYNGELIQLIISAVFLAVYIPSWLSNLYGVSFMALMLYILMMADILVFRSCRKSIYNDSVLVKRHLFQRSRIKIPDNICVADLFHKELLDYITEFVIGYGYECLCVTHIHVIRYIEQNLGNMVTVTYNPNEYIKKDLKHAKNALIKSCGKCSSCEKRSACHLFKPQTVKMYNVSIKRKES